MNKTWSVAWAEVKRMPMVYAGIYRLLQNPVVSVRVGKELHGRTRLQLDYAGERIIVRGFPAR